MKMQPLLFPCFIAILSLAVDLHTSSQSDVEGEEQLFGYIQKFYSLGLALWVDVDSYTILSSSGPTVMVPALRNAVYPMRFPILILVAFLVN